MYVTFCLLFTQFLKSYPPQFWFPVHQILLSTISEFWIEVSRRLLRIDSIFIWKKKMEQYLDGREITLSFKNAFEKTFQTFFDFSWTKQDLGSFRLSDLFSFSNTKVAFTITRHKL